MLTKSLASIILLCAIGSIVSGYTLDGYWDMTPTGAGQYQAIKQMVTFQFKREVDSGGKIVSYLYVYNCFLAKFLYEISEREIWFNFKTSSILSQNCSIAQISEIRNLLQKVFFYSIRYDQLALLDPRGTAVFSMVREKIDYKNAMVGIWDLFTNQDRASTLTYINGTDIYMCRDLSTFSYNLTTTNGSYPQLTVRKGILGACNDSLFVNGISKAAFFQVAENRSQLLIFDRIGQYILTMNQQGSIKPNLKLASDPSPPAQKSPIVQTLPRYVPPKQSSQPTSSNSQNKPISSNIEASKSVQPQSTYKSPPQQPLLVQPVPVSQQASQIPSSQPTEANKYTQQNKANSIKQPTSEPVQPAQSPSPSQHIKVIESAQTSQSSSRSQQTVDSSFFSFDQTSEFSNSYSFDFGSSSFTSPVQVAPQPTYIDPVPSSVTSSSYAQTNAPSIPNQAYSTQVPLEFGPDLIQNDNFAGEFSFVSQDQSFNADTFSSQGQPELFIPSEIPLDSQANQSPQSNQPLETPLKELIQQNKWLINWLNGLNVVPKHLRRVYLVFTSTRIILYCPCNIYYTGYQLQGNNLKGLQWMGTQNQCDNNRDSELTNYIFYSNRIKANGNNLVFYFSTQVKAAEFQPYF